MTFFSRIWKHTELFISSLTSDTLKQKQDKSKRIMAEYNDLLNATPFSLVDIFQPFDLKSCLHFHAKVTPNQILFSHFGKVKVDFLL